MTNFIKEVYDIVGEFAFERIDLHLEEAKKLEIVENCKGSKRLLKSKAKV
ncbi:hypothetical protein N9Y89_02175 [bacterium]|nr:hypothetical protein [bacterium]